VTGPKEIEVLGVYMAPLAVYLAIAVAIFVLIQPVLNRLPLDRWIIDRPMLELALLVILTGLVVLAAIGL
jgi:Protein of unknown function (DUF1656)